MSVLTTLLIFWGTLSVILMQAGFSMMEAGLTREKNAGSIVMKHLFALAGSMIAFWFLGFGIAFGKGNGFFGTVDFFSLGDYSRVFPEGVETAEAIAFYGALSAIPLIVLSGAVAERIRHSSYLVLCILISLFVIPFELHWTLGNGFLAQLGFHDAASIAAIEMTGGILALIGAKMTGPRIGKYRKDGSARAIPGCSRTLPLFGVLLIAFCLPGRICAALSFAGEDMEMLSAAPILLNILISASMSIFAAIAVTWMRYKKPDISIAVNACLAGMISVSAGCDEVSTAGSACIGLLTGAALVFSIEMVDTRLHIDDPVGAISTCGMSGAMGLLLEGLFSEEGGLFLGRGTALLFANFAAVLVIMAWTAGAGWLIFVFTNRNYGLRISEKEEIEGVSSSEHGLANDFVDYMPSVNPLRPLPETHSVRELPVDASVPIRTEKPSADKGDEHPLTKVEIICRQSKFEALKDAMNRIGVTGMSVTQILGCGVQKGAAEYYRGVPMDIQLLPKVRVEIVVASVPVSEVVNTARRVLYTGHIGDGKIFLYDVMDAVKVRTGETGFDAMQGPDLEE